MTPFTDAVAELLSYLVEFFQQPQCGNKIVFIRDGDKQCLASSQQKHNDTLVHINHSGKNTVVHETPPVICRETKEFQHRDEAKLSGCDVLF